MNREKNELDLSLVIPACNEEDRIRSTLESYVLFLDLTGVRYEIIVEMDGCTDATSAVVKEFNANRPQIKRLEFKQKLGKGGGLLKGFEQSKGRYIGFVDADGSVQPDQFYKLFCKIAEGHDCVIASRKMPGAEVLYQPRSRRVMGRCFNILVRLLFGLPYKDTQCGAKIFRREVLDQALSGTNINGFAIDVSLLYLIVKSGFSIQEVGIKWEERDGSKVDIPHTVVDMLYSVIQLRLMFSPFRFLVKRPKYDVYKVDRPF
jgi:glycosyltransferase involved in cell wall biosynthesis